jgi:hypothetical protein
VDGTICHQIPRNRTPRSAVISFRFEAWKKSIAESFPLIVPDDIHHWKHNHRRNYGETSVSPSPAAGFNKDWPARGPINVITI